MKLIRLRLEQFRQFNEPLEINGLNEGINLFVGPNESGKSTLAQAIRAAFFERHKSSSASELQPWGDSGASPEIELDFQWKAQSWQLKKRFLKRRRSDLRVDSQEFNGDEADEKLAALLGYQFARKGPSKAEHHGIPGLLWVEQGAVQEIRDPVANAGDYLKGALGSSLGEITSTAGDALITCVEKERNEWLKKNGQPRGEYQSLISQCEEHQKKLHELEAEIDTYREQVDQLGRLREQQNTIDAERPWEEYRERAQQAEEQHARVKALQESRERAQQSLENCRNQQGLYRQQLETFNGEQEQLQKRAEEKEKAQRSFEQCNALRPQLETKLATARQTHDQRVATLRQVRQQASRDSLKKEREQLAAKLTERQSSLERARSLQEKIQQQRQKLQKTVIDSNLLNDLVHCEEKLVEIRAQQKAVATRLGYELEADQFLIIGGETVTGQGERLLLDDTELTIPGIGKLRLQPGGADVAELRREQAKYEEERDSLLQQMGIQNLHEGQQRASETRDLERAIRQDRVGLEALVPEGLEEREAQCRLDNERLAELAARLEQLPPDQSGLPSLTDAESEVEDAAVALKAVEEEDQKSRRELDLADHAHNAANREWERLSQAINAEDRKARREHASRQLVELKAQETQFGEQLEQLRQQIEDADPGTIENDIQRFTDSANSMEEAARERAQLVRDLQTRLEVSGARGLEEKYAELQHESERLQRRRDELARRANALDLLLNLLNEKRQALTRQLQEPLQKHLNHYLKLLFPGAALAVDDNLIPSSLTRRLNSGEERGAFEALSYGAREQMGLISRLAYADLLREAGQPTLIILDDALVHSDSTRLEQMKRILFDAAQRHQILLFSCHPENWRDLGVTPCDMQALKVSAA